MRDLTPALRRYLWLVYLAGAALCAVELPALTAQARAWQTVPDHLGVVLLFAALAYIGERTVFDAGPATLESLSTSVYVAAILLFPPPIPLLVVLVAVGISHGFAQISGERTPLYKRAYNIAHSLILVGGSSYVLHQVAPPGPLLPHAHMLAATPYIVALLPVYYVLDVGPMLILIGLLTEQSPWGVWMRTYRRTLIPELAASAIGILAAAVWYVEPFYLILFAIPVAALRSAFSAIVEREERAARLRRRGEQLETILTTVRQLQVPSSDLLVAIAAAARTISGAGAAAIYRRDDRDPTMLSLHVVIARDAEGTEPPGRLPALPWHDGIGVEESAEGRTILIPLERDHHVAVSLVWLGAVPAESDDYRDVLAILAAQGGVTLENRRLHERALARAAEDSLTGLLNHRSVQSRLDEELTRAARTGRPVAFLMIDLDDFSLINNTYGHQSGDAAIGAVAGVLRESARSSDIVGRYGGDEFALVLPDTDALAALEVAERVRAAVAALRIVTDATTIRVSASIGVSAFPAHGRTREEVIRAADQASYAAKQAGKGRVARPEEAMPLLDGDPQRLRGQLADANMATVEALAAAVDIKDGYTYGHSRRVSAYAAAIAYALGLARADIARLRLAGLLHDVGKIGIPDAILTKPGPLDEAEYAVVKEHAAIGAQLLASVPYLRDILPAVHHHHERWDGLGYPDGLGGTAIPRDATVLMVADAFDAMTSSRVYRRELSWTEAARRVAEGKGTQFAPDIVDAFARALVDGTLRDPLVESRKPKVESGSDDGRGDRILL